MVRYFSHKHSQISVNYAEDSKGLLLDSHDAVELADALCRNADIIGKDLSEMQAAALYGFKNQGLDGSDLTGKLIGEKLRQYADIFDSLFFFDSLGERINICIHPSLGPEGNVAETNFRYRTKRLKNMPLLFVWQDACKLDFFLQDQSTKIKDLSSLLPILGSLLHEMIHAFFLLWSCDYQACDERMEANGCTGHGLAWQKAAKAIEKRAKILLDLDLSLDRAASLTYELTISGNDISTSELDALGIKPEAVKWHTEKDATRWKDVWGQSRLADSKLKRFLLACIGIRN